MRHLTSPNRVLKDFVSRFSANKHTLKSRSKWLILGAGTALLLISHDGFAQKPEEVAQVVINADFYDPTTFPSINDPETPEPIILQEILAPVDAVPITFDNGFAELANATDDVMGIPILAPVVNKDTGWIEQLTSTGLAYYDPESNIPAFTDAHSRYALTSDVGLVKWSGNELLPPDWVIASYLPVVLTPYEYLYATYPRIAYALDRIITCESNWYPLAKSPTSTASGLSQFLSSTWVITPQGRAGFSVFNPIANIDGAAWLYGQNGAYPWLASNRCHRLLG